MDNLPKYALSIRQPWAYAILHCGKDIENRNWFTRFREPFCIHAAIEAAGSNDIPQMIEAYNDLKEYRL